jgi:pimeloyl-ACP methyl ester carboxylesterase
MKILSLFTHLFKWFVIVLILLFALATFVGKAYGQTIILVLIAVILGYWPKKISSRWNQKVSLSIRILSIILLFIVMKVFFPSTPKKSIYISGSLNQELMEIYDQKLQSWPEGTESIFIPTNYGKVHVLAYGEKQNPPLLLIHAASMGAHSWLENLPAIQEHYRIYSIDNIGEGNKSQLQDALVYPQNGKEIADLYAVIADSLGVESSTVFGSSNGGFIALSYGLHYPERVKSILLFGPMGLTKLTNGSIFMLSAASMYPFQAIRNKVANWALGTAPYCHEKYGDWFDCIIRGTIPSVAKPIPLSDEQKLTMNMPVLLFLGTKDKIVGDVQKAKQSGEVFPNIRIEILDSGHLIAVEKWAYVNKIIPEFLSNQ